MAIFEVSKIRRARGQVGRLRGILNENGLKLENLGDIVSDLRQLEHIKLREFIHNSGPDEIIRQAAYIARVAGS